MRVIKVRYLPATNTRGERLCASSGAFRVVVPWDYTQDADTMRFVAARDFCARYGLHGKLYLAKPTGASGISLFVLSTGETSWLEV